MKPTTYREERSLLDFASAPLLVGFLWEGIVRCGRRILTFMAAHPIASALIGYALGGSGGALVASFVAGGLWWSARRHARAALEVRIEPPPAACDHRWELTGGADRSWHWRCRLCGATAEL